MTGGCIQIKLEFVLLGVHKLEAAYLTDSCHCLQMTTPFVSQVLAIIIASFKNRVTR